MLSTSFGEEVSWDYLCYVRMHPTKTVMQNGDYWFHAKEQMRFLDEWIMSEIRGRK